jgi:hypothetical protein
MSPERSTFKTEIITFLCIGVFAVWYLVAALKLQIGTAANPGPGFIPVVVSILLMVCTGIASVRFFLTRKTPSPEPLCFSPPKSNLRVYAILVGTLLYPFALESVGFLLSTWAVVFFMLLLLKPRDLVRAICLSFFLAGGAFGVFSILLGVSFPFGFLDEFIYRMMSR